MHATKERGTGLHQKSWILPLGRRKATHERGSKPTATVHPCAAMRARLDATGASSEPSRWEPYPVA